MDAVEYNYSVFDMAREEPVFAAFRGALHAGERAPDSMVERLDDGVAVPLKSVWRGGPAVIEFGSFT